MPSPRVAIACQGGGSHAAFTAGVLLELLSPAHRDRFDLAGLSGTSGGAVCAALAWAGLIAGGPEDAAARLRDFWADLAVADPWIDPWDALLNNWVLWTARLPVTAEVSPYAYSPAAEPRLRQLLTRHLRLAELPKDPMRRARPALRLGAANVLEGGGMAFPGETLVLEEVVASAAVPPLFRAVAARGALWWDGLYSQNPPVRELLDLDPKPQEIWVVRLNPERLAGEPRMVAEIEDRRNEMAGNLPLDHELYLIAKLNRLRLEFSELQARYDAITVRQVELDIALDYPSKLDRSPAHLRRLMDRGRQKAALFFGPDSVRVRPDGL